MAKVTVSTDNTPDTIKVEDAWKDDILVLDTDGDVMVATGSTDDGDSINFIYRGTATGLGSDTKRKGTMLRRAPRGTSFTVTQE